MFDTDSNVGNSTAFVPGLLVRVIYNREAVGWGIAPGRPAAYATSLNSSLYRATPDTPAMARASRIKTMNTASGTPSHWLARPCPEAGSNLKRG